MLRNATNVIKTAARNFASQAPKQEPKIPYTADPAAPVESVGIVVAGLAAYVGYEHYNEPRKAPSTQLENGAGKIQQEGKAAPAPTVAKSK